MTITRRKLMVGTAALAAAGLPIAAKAADPEEAQFLMVFRQLPDLKRAMIHDLARRFAGLPSDPELLRRRGYEPDGVTPLKAVEGGEAGL